MDRDRKVFLRDVNLKIADGDYQSALDICEESPSAMPGDSEWIRARVYFAREHLDLAETFAVKAISKSPSNYAYYRTLGEILGALGHVDAARRCLQGSQFNDYINKKYFLNEHRSLKVEYDCSHQDLVMYREAAKPLPAFIGHTEPSVYRDEFRHTEIQSSVATVQVIENGKVWFDGHNLCVYDLHDKLVKSCTMGNPALIERIRRDAHITTIDGNLGVVVARSAGNYFHWTTDVLPGFHLLAQAVTGHGKTEKILVSHQEKQFQNELMSAAGVELQRVFCSGGSAGYYFSAKKLIVPVFRHKMAMAMSEWSIDFLRALHHRDTKPPPRVKRRIYISRRDVKSRGIENEDDVIRSLRKYGFEDVTLDGKSVHEQMQLFQESGFIVAPHGAGLTNIVYCEPGSTVFEFFGDFVQPCFRSLAALAQLHYAHLSTSKVVTEAGTLEKSLHKSKVQRQDQWVDIEELERMLERLGAGKTNQPEKVA